jgi:hypothetical protein
MAKPITVLRSSSTVSPNGVICALCLPVCRGDPRVCRPATDPRVTGDPAIHLVFVAFFVLNAQDGPAQDAGH